MARRRDLPWRKKILPVAHEWPFEQSFLAIP